jgi:hypothetical protein
VEAYEEAWRTFSWSEHLTLEFSVPSEAPYVSGGTVILPIYNGFEEGLRTLVVQSIPSPLRGIPGRRWQIDFDFFVKHFTIDATQDLLVVAPRHDTSTLMSSFFLSRAYTHDVFFYHAAYLCAHCRPVGRMPFLPMREFSVWELLTTLRRAIANTRHVATFWA